ncbi:MAG: hypothetical protein U1E62_11985 [Alsobacter sp.]
MSDDNVLLDSDAAAGWLQANYGFCTRKSLEKHRHFSTGPRYRKIGNFVRYTVADLRAWVEGKMGGQAFRGTAEYRENAA